MTTINVSFHIKNFSEMTSLSVGNKRIKSVLKDLRNELVKGNIINNIVVASDEQDTQWLFDVKKITNGRHELDFTGTAK